MKVRNKVTGQIYELSAEEYGGYQNDPLLKKKYDFLEQEPASRAAAPPSEARPSPTKKADA